MKFNIITTTKEWDLIAKEWNQLLQNSIKNIPFLTHEFQQAWWKHLGGGEWTDAQLQIIIAKNESSEIVGIAPLMSCKNDAGKNVLMFIGSLEIADYLDVIVHPENHQVFIEHLLKYLLSISDWDDIELNNILADSPTIEALKKAATPTKLRFDEKMLQPAPRINLPSDFDDYIANLDKKYRHELKRKMRNAAGYFIPIKHYSVTELDQLDQEFDDFETLMMQEDRKANFLHANMLKQMRTIAHAAFKGGWLNLKFLTIGKDKAGGFFCFDYNNTVWLYNSGMSNKYGNLSPGHVLIGHLLMESIEQGKKYFDFMRGDEEYKYHLGGKNQYIHQVKLSR